MSLLPFIIVAWCIAILVICRVFAGCKEQDAFFNRNEP